MKIFNLPFNEFGLYVCGIFMLSISAILLFLLFCELWGSKTDINIAILLIGLYIFTPVIMHNMGLVFWTHSIMQVIIPAYLLLYVRCIKKGSPICWILLMVLCIVAPYVEWTGFVINVGLALSELYRRRDSGLKSLKIPLIIGLCTLTSLALIILHFFSVLDPIETVNLLRQRVEYRSGTTGVGAFIRSILKIGATYVYSYLLYIVVIIVGAIIIKRKGIRIEIPVGFSSVLFVAFFALIENFVMLEHAASYTFDCMKASLPIWLLLYLVINSLKAKYALFTSNYFSLLCCCIACVFFALYVSTDFYIWRIDYRSGNEKIATIIQDRYDDSVIGFNDRVRGYINIVFDRGVYERVQSVDDVIKLAEDSGCQYAVYLKKSEVPNKFSFGDFPVDAWDMYKVDAVIIDIINNTETEVINLGDSIEIK